MSHGASVNTGRTIGWLAAQAGVKVDTVRYYERAGLMPPPARRVSGYRQYSESDVERLRFIRRAKQLGFDLSEISELLSLTAERRSDMQGVKRKAEQRLAQLNRRIRELEQVREGLEALIDACPGHGELRTCPIVAALNGRDPLEERSDE